MATAQIINQPNELIHYMASNLVITAWKMEGAKDEKCWGVLGVRGNALPFTVWGSRNTGGLNISEKDAPMDVVVSKERKGYRHFMASEDYSEWPTLQKRLGTFEDRKNWIKSIISDLPMSFMDSVMELLNNEANSTSQTTKTPVGELPHWALQAADESAWF